jgi:hypothetical protein
MDRDRPLREHLLALLRGGSAHLDFDAALADVPPTRAGVPARVCPTKPSRT